MNEEVKPAQPEEKTGPATIEIDFAARKAILDRNFKDLKEARETRFAQVKQLEMEIAGITEELNRQQGAYAEIERLENEHKEKTEKAKQPAVEGPTTPPAPATTA